MPKYLSAGLTQYVLNNFFKKSPPYHVKQDNVSAALERLEMEKITGHQSVRGRGEVIVVLYKTHWAGLSEPSWERETDLQLSRTQILRYWAGIPDPHRLTTRLYRRMHIDAGQREISRNNGECFWRPATLASHARSASPLPRHSAPQGSPLLVQGRPRVVVAWKNQRKYDCKWGIPGPVFRRPGADQASFPSGTLHDFNGGRTRFLVPPGPRSQRVPSGYPT